MTGEPTPVENMSEIRFTVPAMTCGHCTSAVQHEVSTVDGVREVTVDLDSKVVVVSGSDVSIDALVAAVDEAGYDLVW